MNRKQNECTKWHDLFRYFVSSVWQLDCLHWKRIWFVSITSDWLDVVGGTYDPITLCHRKEKWKILILFVCFAHGKDSAHWSDVLSLLPNSPLFQFLFSIFSAKENWDSSSSEEKNSIKKVRQHIHIMWVPFCFISPILCVIVSIENTCGELLFCKSFLIECKTI